MHDHNYVIFHYQNTIRLHMIIWHLYSNILFNDQDIILIRCILNMNLYWNCPTQQITTTSIIWPGWTTRILANLESFRYFRWLLLRQHSLPLLQSIVAVLVELFKYTPPLHGVRLFNGYNRRTTVVGNSQRGTLRVHGGTACRIRSSH